MSKKSDQYLFVAICLAGSSVCVCHFVMLPLSWLSVIRSSPCISVVHDNFWNAIVGLQLGTNWYGSYTDKYLLVRSKTDQKGYAIIVW